jgi:hypothetical protein
MTARLNKPALLLTLVWALLLPSERALSIGKTGNNEKLGDPVEGFTASTPSAFSDVYTARDRSAKLVSHELIDVGLSPGDPLVEPLSMLAYPLASAYPELVGKSREEMVAYLNGKFSLNLTDVTSDPCGVFLFGENDVGYFGIAQWDGGHGYVLTAQKTQSRLGKTGILELMTSTKLDQSCSK